MNIKNWLLVWVLFFLIIPSVGFFNYVVDPFNYNKKFDFYNSVKTRIDEREEKFYHLSKNKNYEAVILGTSKGTFLDPSLIKEYTSYNTFNAAFSAGTVDEFLLFSKWIIENLRVKLLIIEFEFYSFSDFRSDGTMPTELSKPRNSLFKYLSLDLFKNSIKTFNYNLQINPRIRSNNEKKLLAKGMRYDADYFVLKENPSLTNQHVNKLRTSEIVWPGNLVKESRINCMKEIIRLCENYKVELILLQSPSSYLQLQHSNYQYYLKLLSLLEKLTTIHEVYFFNDFNDLNMDLSLFIDNEHFNYDANKFIFERIFKNKGYGVKLTKSNFLDHKSKILNKLSL